MRKTWQYFLLPGPISGGGWLWRPCRWWYQVRQLAFTPQKAFGCCSGCGFVPAPAEPGGGHRPGPRRGQHQPSAAAGGGPSSPGRPDRAVNEVNWRSFSPWKEPSADASQQASQQGRQPRPGAPRAQPLAPRAGAGAGFVSC